MRENAVHRGATDPIMEVRRCEVARGRMKRVEQRAAARGHDIVWEYVEDVRVHGTCRRCGQKVRITRPYGEGTTVVGELLHHDCPGEASTDSEA